MPETPTQEAQMSRTDAHTIITAAISRALACELAVRWTDAADAWLDAFCVAIKEDSASEARQYLANSRSCDRQARKVADAAPQAP